MENKLKPRVFLSSALYGLEDLRSIIIDFFENEKGYFTIYYGDRCSGPLTGEPGIANQCLEGVRSSNALLLIVDRRYGEPNYKNDMGNPISLTELEFLEAKKHNIPIYIFCRLEVCTLHKFWKYNQNMNIKKADARYDNPTELMNFLTRLKEYERLFPRFLDAAELKKGLLKSELSVDSMKKLPTLIGERENLEVTS